MVDKKWTGRTVLIVDDSSVVRKSLVTLFSNLGFNIVGQAEDGLTAVEMSQNLSPDVISLDIILPEMHGIESYRMIKEHNIEQRVLFISSLGKEIAFVEGSNEDFQDEIFMEKIPTIEHLNEQLEKLFSRKAIKEAENTAS